MLARLALAVAVVASNGAVSLVGVYPNPATDGDAGEYVVLEADPETNLEGYAITDGEDTVSLPNETVSGRVAITDDPRVTRGFANETTVVTAEGLSLSNAGESVRLRRDGQHVSTLTYDRAPTAEVWDGETWTPLGATSFPVVTSEDVQMTAYALPDSPGLPLDRLAAAENRVVLAGYTLTSEAVVEALLAAHRDGASVQVLVEESPVGGTPQRQVAALDRLDAAGIDVRASGGPRARYDYHHAKYAVVDDAVFVTSENWKPSGVGGHASRGWGVVLRDEALASHLATVFAADATWVDGQAWPSLAPEGQPGGPATADFPQRFPPVRTTASDVRVLVAPDNAEPELRRLLRGANDSIRIQQVSVDPDGPLLAESIAAAERGVEVKLLLSDTWYVQEENRALAENLTRRADRDDLPLSVALAEPRSRYDHIHVKGVVIDERQSVVGSLNWNRHALRENREVAVVVTDPEIGAYYTRLFRADWRGAAWRVHWLTLVGLGVAVVGAIVAGAGVAFDPPEKR